MNSRASGDTAPSASLPNGSGAAAILAAGIGSFVLAVISIAADKLEAIKSMMDFYKPTGPLSGVTTSAILAWLVIWFVLDRRWQKQTVSLGRINTAALTLLCLSLLLTFPPVADLF